MKLYNTMSLKIEEFKPINEGEVTIYTCGPTVYDYAHIGNMRTYVSEDILVRAFDYIGYNVKRAMNITDVGHLTGDADDGEDKMLQGAKREKKTVYEIAEYYTNAFFRDFYSLNLKKPEIIKKATDYIKEYIDFILILKEKGYTYEVDGNVYYDISKFPDYTKLSRMPLENLQVGMASDSVIDKNKKNPFDFVLWFTKSKFENQEMKWPSPFGIGYPGWHLECSVIALEAFGNKLDIHCGGVDHIPTHHTNEIAQSEAATGEKWVNYWWHAEWLIDNNGKMSKSSGKFLSLETLIDLGYNPMHYKYYLLGSHYRRQLSFTFDSLDGAKDAYIKLKARVMRLKGSEKNKKTDEYIERFKSFLKDDLNTANILTLIYDCLKDNNLNQANKRFIIEEIEKVLMLDLFKEVELDKELEKKVIKLIKERDLAKINKDYHKADLIRDELKKDGIELIDTKEGTKWQIIN